MGMKSKTKHYIGSDGVYLGGFGDGAKIPAGSKVVPAPKHGRDTWDGVKWIDYAPEPKSAPDLIAAIQAIINGDMIAAQEAVDRME